MQYKSRKAAWTAMIIMQYLKKRGVLQFEPNHDGSVKLFYAGMWTTMRWDGSKLRLEPMLVIRPKRGSKRGVVPVPGSSEAFEARGDQWNARNYQHNAQRELPANPRKNAFGDLCQKPTIDGYEDWGPLGYDRRIHERLTRMEQRSERNPESRKLAQVRMKYRQGKLG